MKPRNLFWCGVMAPLLFTFMTILGGALRPGYSHVADTVSELMSPGSPNRIMLSLLFSIYALLIASFGFGLLQFVRTSQQPSSAGSIGAWLYITAGVINVSIATVFPQDPWGTPFTFPGMMHLVLSGVIGILQMIAIALLGIWLWREGISTRMGVYSLLTAGTVLLLVGCFIAMAGTSYLGLAERSLILIGLMWTFVVAVWMLSSQNNARLLNLKSM